ncbi:MAG: hypothetical protein ACLU37_10690 [Collinsella sp.]
MGWLSGPHYPIVIACAILAFLGSACTRSFPRCSTLCDPARLGVRDRARDPCCRRPHLCLGRERHSRSVRPLLTLPFGIGSFIVGLFYAPTVVTGIHQMYTAIDLGQLAQYGVTYWLPIASAANIAQVAPRSPLPLRPRCQDQGLALPSACPPSWALPSLPSLV